MVYWNVDGEGFFGDIDGGDFFVIYCDLKFCEFFYYWMYLVDDRVIDM